MSYTRLLYHIVFRTKYGAYAINETHENELYRCIWKFVQEHQCILYRVNGMPDHIHLFVEIHQTIPVSEFVRKLKKTTHLFLEQNKPLFPNFTEWAVGYCALTYSERDKEKIINYIKNQKEHHKHTSFMDEINVLLTEAGVKVDANFVDRNL